MKKKIKDLLLGLLIISTLIILSGIATTVEEVPKSKVIEVEPQAKAVKTALPRMTNLGLTNTNEWVEPLEAMGGSIPEEYLEETYYTPPSVYNYTSDVTTQNYILFAWEQFSWYGWSEYDLECLINLWHRESKWNPLAHNPSSGAHGIPQSLPAEKMASYGADYWDNGYTQILWGLDYIYGRYGTPASALAHAYSVGWY